MLTSSTSTRLLVTVMLVLVAAAAGAQSEFRPGEVWLDTDGKPIQAHSAGNRLGPSDTRLAAALKQPCCLAKPCNP
jgi:hypothetical protein